MRLSVKPAMHCSGTGTERRVRCPQGSNGSGGGLEHPTLPSRSGLSSASQTPPDSDPAICPGPARGMAASPQKIMPRRLKRAPYRVEYYTWVLHRGALRMQSNP